MKLVWMIVLLGPVAAGAQTGTPVANTQPAATQVYTNAELHLRFAYPAEMIPRNAQAAAELGQQMLYGEDDGTDARTAMAGGAGRARSTTCMKTLLSVGTDREAAKTPAGSEGGSARAAGGAAGATDGAGSVALFDIDLRCLPPKAQKNRKLMDSVLAGLATQGTTVLGMMPVEQAVGYLLEGQRAYFASAQGQPVAQTDLQPGDDAELTGVVATAVGGHILAWRLEANSVAYFNRLLRSQVDFGTGPAGMLFPGQVQ
jgi:hypothetical protein